MRARASCKMPKWIDLLLVLQLYGPYGMQSDFRSECLYWMFETLVYDTSFRLVLTLF